MRRKIGLAVCLTLALVLMVCAATVFAEGGSNGFRWSSSNQESSSSGNPEAGETQSGPGGGPGSGPGGSAYQEQYQERVEAILRNQERIDELDRQVREEALRLQEHLRRLQEEPGRIDEEDLVQLREGLRLMNANRRELGETVGHIHRHTHQHRHNQKEGNYTASLDDLDDIIDVQQSRIRIMSELLDDMENLQK